MCLTKLLYFFVSVANQLFLNSIVSSEVLGNHKFMKVTAKFLLLTGKTPPGHSKINAERAASNCFESIYRLVECNLA